jgi:hypothetical protein
MNASPFLRTAWWHVLTVGAFACCSTAFGEPAVTPEQNFPPGYLESVSTGYDNGQAVQAQTPDKTPAKTSRPAAQPLLVAQPTAPISSPNKRKSLK